MVSDTSIFQKKNRERERENSAGTTSSYLGQRKELELLYTFTKKDPLMKLLYNAKNIPKNQEKGNR